MGILFMGIETKAREGWEKLFRPCQATRSSKPESVAKEVAEKIAQRVADAATTPFLAQVTAATLLNGAGNVIFQANSSQAAHDVLLQLENYFRDVVDDRPYLPRLYCCDARNAIRIIATDAASFEFPLDKPLTYWLRSSLTPVPWADPVDVFINSALYHDIGLGGLCKFLGVKHELGDELPASAEARARLAREIAIKGKLVL